MIILVFKFSLVLLKIDIGKREKVSYKSIITYYYDANIIDYFLTLFVIFKNLLIISK